MEIRCTPRILSGKTNAISSKSHMHRLLICSALAEEPTTVYCNCLSEDIKATARCLKAMGTEINIENDRITVYPSPFKNRAELNCGESGSTLRFLLPVVSALGIEAVFSAEGRLPLRPLSPLKEEMEKRGAHFHNEGTFPLQISGQLTSGEFVLRGDVSSQFISGLLFSLPLLSGDSTIRLLPPVESRSYIDITVSSIKSFGIEIEEEENLFKIKGGQKYQSPREITAEGDWSNSAFFLCAGALSPEGVTVAGLDVNSAQGDKKIVDILKRMGAEVAVNGNDVTVRKNKLFGTVIDGSDIPDLVPVLSVISALCEKGVTHIINAERLRLKESDRLSSVNRMLTNAGAAVSETDDGLVIWGENNLTGGKTDGCNDHRIVMSAAVLSSLCSLPVDISGAEAVNKSYPNFFEDFNSLGGSADVINDGK